VVFSFTRPLTGISTQGQMPNIQKSDEMINDETETSSVSTRPDDTTEYNLQDGQDDQICEFAVFKFVTSGIL